ncbi:MAG: hypothetical protein AB1646_25990 [Thermodesulfobacteriota bacterium]
MARHIPASSASDQRSGCLQWIGIVALCAISLATACRVPCEAYETMRYPILSGPVSVDADLFRCPSVKPGDASSTYCLSILLVTHRDGSFTISWPTFRPAPTVSKAISRIKEKTGWKGEYLFVPGSGGGRDSIHGELEHVFAVRDDDLVHIGAVVPGLTEESGPGSSFDGNFFYDTLGAPGPAFVTQAASRYRVAMVEKNGAFVADLERTWNLNRSRYAENRGELSRIRNAQEGQPTDTAPNELVTLLHFNAGLARYCDRALALRQSLAGAKEVLAHDEYARFVQAVMDLPPAEVPYQVELTRYEHVRYPILSGPIRVDADLLNSEDVADEELRAHAYFSLVVSHGDRQFVLSTEIAGGLTVSQAVSDIRQGTGWKQGYLFVPTSCGTGNMWRCHAEHVFAVRKDKLVHFGTVVPMPERSQGRGPGNALQDGFFYDTHSVLETNRLTCHASAPAIEVAMVERDGILVIDRERTWQIHKRRADSAGGTPRIPVPPDVEREGERAGLLFDAALALLCGRREEYAKAHAEAKKYLIEDEYEFYMQALSPLLPPDPAVKAKPRKVLPPIRPKR